MSTTYTLRKDVAKVTSAIGRTLVPSQCTFRKEILPETLWPPSGFVINVGRGLGNHFYFTGSIGMLVYKYE